MIRSDNTSDETGLPAASQYPVLSDVVFDVTLDIPKSVDLDTAEALHTQVVSHLESTAKAPIEVLSSSVVTDDQDRPKRIDITFTVDDSDRTVGEVNWHGLVELDDVGLVEIYPFITSARSSVGWKPHTT